VQAGHTEGLQQLLRRRVLLQAHDEAALEHASPWVLAMSQCGALCGTRLAAERAYGEHAGTYVTQLKTALRKKKRERQLLRRSAAPVLSLCLSFRTQANYMLKTCK